MKCKFCGVVSGPFIDGICVYCIIKNSILREVRK